MAPNSITGEEKQIFQHQQTLRRTNESDLSRPTGEPSVKRPKLDSCLVPADNSDDDEDEEEDDDNDDDYNDDAEANNAQGKDVPKKVRRRSATRKHNVAKNKMKRVAAARRANQRKRVASNAASEQVSLNELKSYMSSLLDEMKDTRGNLLTWLKEELKKTIAEEVTSELQRRQLSFHVNKQKTGSVEDTRALNTSKNRQVQQTMQQQSNFEENNRVRTIQGSIKQQRVSSFWSSRRDENCGVEIPQRFANNNNKTPSDDAYNFINLETENPNDDSMATRPTTPTEKATKGMLLSVKSNSLVQDQLQQKRAHHTTSGLSKRYREGKRVVVDSGNHCNVPRGKEAIISVASSTENKHKATRSAFCVEPNFTCNQAPPSMYLTLPSVLNGVNRNHRPDVPSFTNVQPNRFPVVETSLNGEGTPNSGSYLGYLQRLMQQHDDERSSRSFAPSGDFRDMSYLRNSYMTTSPIAATTVVGFHQSSEMGNFNTPPRQPGMESLSRQINYGVGLRNIGEEGMMFSGGSYSLPVQHFPNTFH